MDRTFTQNTKGQINKKNTYLVTVHEEVEIYVDGEFVGLNRQQA
jgi:hypothetical protein